MAYVQTPLFRKLTSVREARVTIMKQRKLNIKRRIIGHVNRRNRTAAPVLLRVSVPYSEVGRRSSKQTYAQDHEYAPYIMFPKK